MNQKQSYDDIIGLPHHVSERRPHMSMHDRAAQFSPFAALTGYHAAIDETARLTEEKIELEESRKQLISRQLSILAEHAKELPEVTAEFFVPDERKTGGAYVIETARATAVDPGRGTLRLNNGRSIAFEDIYALNGAVFDRYFPQGL